MCNRNQMTQQNFEACAIGVKMVTQICKKSYGLQQMESFFHEWLVAAFSKDNSQRWEIVLTMQLIIFETSDRLK